MRFRSILLSAVLAAVLATPTVAAERLKVVASFSILGDLAEEIGGDNVKVLTLVGPNGDAHSFEPSPASAKSLGSADVLIENGLGFEPWLERLVKVSKFSGDTVVASKGVTPREWAGEEGEVEAGHHDHDKAAHEEAHDHGPVDPHAWQDPKNGIRYVENIVAGFSAADPSHAADYATRGAALAEKLNVIDARFSAEFAKLPEARRRIVTNHDAFGYFGAAYGIEFIAPEGLSTESEVSAASLAAIIRQVKRDGISAIFVENISDPRLVQQIARETGVKVGGELFSDALSPKDGPAPTYVKMFENNEAQFMAAMSGS